MKKEKTVELLARFMEGMTTVEEEEVLADFFRNATDDDKPAGMPYDDWAAYREMFRQFDDGFHEKREVQKNSMTRALWYCMSAAAVAACFVMAFISDFGNNSQSHLLTEAGRQDTTKTVTMPASTVKTDSADVAPQRENKTKRQKKSKYSIPVPRHMLAAATETDNAREDSMAMALEEAERLVNAMTVYQEIRINEICNVDYEEEY